MLSEWIPAAAALSGWFASILAPAIGGLHERHVDGQSLQDSSTRPGFVSQVTDRFWKAAAVRLSETAERRRQELAQRLSKRWEEMPAVPLWPGIPGPKGEEAQGETELLLTRRYGVLPEVRVDMGHGAIFPAAVAKPLRFSWFQIVDQTTALLGALKRFSREEKERKTPEAFLELETEWLRLIQSAKRIAAQTRYVSAWQPRLSSKSSSVASAIADGQWDQLRHTLKPKRVLRRAFLPAVLPDHRRDGRARALTVPIVTDVTDPRFIREFEAAIDVHWNQSPWARKNGVRFRVRWKFVPENKKLKSGKETLARHLGRFPRAMAGLTTGGLALETRGHVLLLAPGTVTPRTLAHEFGHILGFEDCYLRTLGGSGIFGTAVLEWTNPIYPDELMCDDTVGVARIAAW